MLSIAFVSAFVCWRSDGQMETRFFRSTVFCFQLKFSSRFAKAISSSARNVIPYPMMPWQHIQLWFLHAIWCFRWKVGNPTISDRWANFSCIFLTKWQTSHGCRHYKCCCSCSAALYRKLQNWRKRKSTNWLITFLIHCHHFWRACFVLHRSSEFAIVYCQVLNFQGA